MLWMVTATSLAGLILGLRFRWPALFAASVLLAICGALLGPFSGWAFAEVVKILAVTIIALQFGYGGGVALAWLVTRQRPAVDSERPAQPVRAAQR